MPEHYAPSFDSVRKHNHLSPADKLVFIELCNQQGRNATCWPPHTLIAENTALSLSQVKRSLKTLIQNKLVGIVEKGTGRKPTTYQVFLLTELNRRRAWAERRKPAPKLVSFPAP